MGKVKKLQSILISFLLFYPPQFRFLQFYIADHIFALVFSQKVRYVLDRFQRFVLFLPDPLLFLFYGLNAFIDSSLKLIWSIVDVVDAHHSIIRVEKIAINVAVRLELYSPIYTWFLLMMNYDILKSVLSLNYLKVINPKLS